MAFDRNLLERIRTEFPRSAADFKGNRRIFFDNGTGTLVTARAARAEAEARLDCSANVGATFEESKEAEETISQGRRAVADLLNAKSPETIVSGESATALLFTLAYSIEKNLSGKENVVTTDYEHYANVSPWVELERRGKIERVRFAHLNKDDGTLDIDHMRSLIDDHTKVVTIAAASNVLGTKSPLEEVGKMAREVGAYFVVDAVHHIAHGPMDVSALGCDFLVFSGYKLFSSHGSFLYGKQECLEELQPYNVAPASNHSPCKWELGTRDQSKFAAIQGVVDYFAWLADQIKDSYVGNFTKCSGRVRSCKVAMKAIEEYEVELSRKVLFGFDGLKGLMDTPQVRVYGISDPNRLEERDPTFSFKVQNVSDEKIVGRLQTEAGIASRAEDFYSRVLEPYGQRTMIRISLVHYNISEEIERFLRTLNMICGSG
jgi:cysteine desulfurase family protein (TIGR01976 family)